MTRGDLPRLVHLYRRAFSETPAVPDAELERYLGGVLFANPWRTDDIPSLVYEDAGTVVGALGVVPRTLLLDRRPVRMAVANHFVADPDLGGLAGIHLLRAFFKGKHDLGIAEGNEASRKVWQTLGGTLSPVYSVHGVTPIRPAAYAVASTGRGALARALAMPLDAVLTRLPGPFRRRAPAFRDEELDVPAFLDALAELTRSYRVRPHYDETSARWLFDLLDRKARFGRLRKRLLREGDRIVGWCVWYEKPRGVGQVVQVCATPADADAVLAWLTHRALVTGLVALAGGLNPLAFGAQAAQILLVSRSHTWMLLQARDPELLAAIQSGQAFLSKMEAEWWIPYHEA
jgi:hypothetical protein